MLLLVTVVLRIPNFFEPYWYGDEAIYLTVGTGIRQGLRLYTEIVDHKTPLIYYFAAVPSQFWFRVLNLFWMMAATVLFFWVAKKLFKKAKLAFASSLIFVLLTTLPWLEGNIPNGELFVLGFVMAGLWLLTKTQLWQQFFRHQLDKALAATKKESKLLVGAGALFGLGVLTKVPALLDFGAVLLIGWFAMTQLALGQKTTWKKRLKLGRQFLAKTGWLTLGLFIPIGLSVIYFVSQGSGQDYLQFGLLYNIYYSGNWQLELHNPLLQFLFTLPGKTLALAGVITLLSFARKYTARFQLIAGWFMLALFATLLSNRPYPHYFIQVVPAFSLLLAELWLIFQHRTAQKKAMLMTAAGLLIAVMAVLPLLKVRPYPAGEYYGKFYQLMTKQITTAEYDHSFNPLVKNNYEAAEMIRGLDGERMFIWGTNPMLYALTQATPTSRFTVAFHIKDLQDQANTLQQIIAEEPTIIVVMNDEPDELPGLQAYLDARYYPNRQFDTMTVYLAL